MEKPEFNRALGEGRVEVEHVVPAGIVVLVSAVVRAVALVPDVPELVHGGGLLAVDSLQESGVYRAAVVAGAAGVDADGSADLLFVACHDVDQIPQGLCGVVALADVDVDSASSGGAALRSSLPKEAEDALQGLDVVVGEDRGDQLAFLVVRSADAHVPLELPNPALLVFASPGHVAVLCGCVVGGGSEELGNLGGCLLSGDVVHLHLDPDGLVLHGFNLRSGLFVHGLYLLCFRCVFFFVFPFRYVHITVRCGQ